MAVLRELLALFKVGFDDKDLKKGQRSTDNLADSIRDFAGVAAAVGLGVGIASMIDGIRLMGDEVNNVSQQLGLSRQALQEWQFIAGDAGLDAGDLFGAFGAISDNAGTAAEGTNDMSKAFARLGVTVKDSRGQLKDTETLVLEMADGLDKLSNETERSNVLQTLAGDDGLRLLGVLKQQRGGIEAVREEFRRLGGGLSDETIQAGVELTNEMGRLNAAFTSLKSAIGLAVLPVLSRLFRGATDIVAVFRQWAEGTQFLEVLFAALGIAAAALAIKIAIAFAPALLTFAAVAAGVTVVLLLVDDLISLFSGGTSVIGTFVDELFGAGTAANVVQDLIVLWNDFLQVVKDTATVVGDFFSDFNLGGLFGNATPRAAGRGVNAGLASDTTRTASLRDTARAAAGGNTVSQSNTVNVNVGGGDEGIASRIRSAVSQALGEQNAEALAALVPEGPE